MENQSDAGKPRWGQARRLAFIDLRLQYDGKMNRRDIQSFFDISTPQASADLDLYKKMAPGNVRYDASARVFVALDSFQPQFGRTAATSYLDELFRLSRGVIEEDESFVGFVPPTGVVATPVRTIDAAEAVVLVRAIRDGVALEVTYQSMDEPTPLRRMITPHAMGFDGLRWHVRAWCHQRSMFRDFAIGRLDVQGKAAIQVPVDPSTDKGWETVVDVVLVPHRDLSPSQRAVVMADYGMRDGRHVLRCRKAMLFYTLRHLNLESPDISPDAARQHVVIENRADVDRWVREDRMAVSPSD